MLFNGEIYNYKFLKDKIKKNILLKQTQILN